MFGKLLALILLAFLKVALSTDYCDPNLCKFGDEVKPHIGCKNNGQFANTCQNPTLVLISPEFQTNITEMHNMLRDKVASGKLKNFKSAARMPTLAWDEELAYLAELHVRRCQMQHDECHNTDEYKWSGQNLGIQYTSCKLDPEIYEPLAMRLINEWFNENAEATQADVNLFNSTSSQKHIGHFTAMIHERTSKIGCACSTYTARVNQKTWNAFLLTCNYSFTNLLDLPIYTKGKKASACETGRNKKYKGLCSADENVLPVP